MADSDPRTLADLHPGASALVDKLAVEERDAIRLMELGFVPGLSVTCLRRVPMGDLSVYQLDGAQISIRRETAARIGVRSADGGERAERG